jgi:arginine exporter protein ArgO
VNDIFCFSRPIICEKVRTIFFFLKEKSSSPQIYLAGMKTLGRVERKGKDKRKTIFFFFLIFFISFILFVLCFLLSFLFFLFKRKKMEEKEEKGNRPFV